MKIIPIILSGGSGTRLWPLSRTQFPKQFVELLDKPLQTLTIERLQKYGSGLLITSQKLKDMTERDIIQNQLKIEKVIYEPLSKNTAAAVALGCRYLELTGRTQEVVGVFPSDSLILKENEFATALKAAVSSAAEGYIVTLGIKPRSPETGFGYIQVKERALNTQKATEVTQFHEKPTLEKALGFLADGHYFWNAGIFVFQAAKMIDLFKKHEPQMWDVISGLKEDFSNLEEIYAHIKSISIDYAIIEKLSSDELRCVTCDIGWSDVGSWDALVEVTEAYSYDDKNLKKRPVQITAKANTVFSRQKKKYGLVGCDDLIVVDTADALLICKKGYSQKVKDLVETLKVEDSKIVNEHVFENRPWGHFEILKDEDHYKSKIMRVDPGQKISYQSHAKRSEHWVIVKGEAVVVLDDQEHVVKQGEHIFIPRLSKHRILNRTGSIVEFIEVQVGSYFGEDDIVRYQDDYGRK
ncbi:MAG: mannose-1-phosphate guanylyltransferase/mannose-6-phosphate isomerase [Bdellovibrio sp.]|nr:mannose-1-phosphate guanylyltransferase/mannose-6-phosphate isomerase [Bdellovibrio sp.]